MGRLVQVFDVATRLCIIFSLRMVVGSPRTFPGKLVAIGTSISDNGNAFKASNQTVPQSPPYYNGRFSNGPVWVEHLAVKTRLPLVDFAFGGAGACDDGNTLGPDGKPVPVPPVGKQAMLYLANATKEDLANNLHIVEGGPNDYFQYLNLVRLGKIDPKTTPVDPKKIAGCMVAAARQLLAKGATKVAVTNMLDLTLTPEFNPAVNKQAAPLAPLLQKAVAAHNQELYVKLMDLHKEYRSAKVVLVDFNLFGKSIAADFAKLGFLNNFESLLTGFVMVKGGPDVPTIIKPIPEKLVWFDRVHPTTKTHKILGIATYHVLLKKVML